MDNDVTSRGTDEGIAWVGPLNTAVLSPVLKTIISQKKTGDLQAMFGPAIKTVHFDQGSVIFAVSNMQDERLGETMVAKGRISDEEFALASSMMATHESRFGQALLRAGLMSEAELICQVEHQVYRIASSVFRAGRGIYSFDERPNPIPDGLAVQLSTSSILLDSVRRAVDAEIIPPESPASDPELRALSDFPVGFDVDDLDLAEASILCVTGPGKSLETIVRQTGFDRQRVVRACFTLLAVGLLECDVPLSAFSRGKSSSPEADAQPRWVSYETTTEGDWSTAGHELPQELPAPMFFDRAQSASDTDADEPSKNSAAGAALETGRERDVGREGWLRERSRQLLRDVKLHFQVQEWEGAIRLLGELLELDPAKPEHHAMLGEAKSRDPGLRNDAERHFLDALRLQPKDANLHFQVGIHYERSGMASRARTEFQSALRLDPKHSEARARLSERPGAKRSMRAVIGAFFR